MSRPTKEDMLADYLNCADALELAVADLGGSDLDLTNGDGWSIRQYVHHIADGDDLWKTAIRIAAGNPGAQFSLAWYWEFPQTKWGESWAYNQRDMHRSLAYFRASRSWIVDLLKQVPESWDNSVSILRPHQQQESRITISEIISMQINHVIGHVADIHAIREAHLRKG